jgi:hypothetical protein
VVGVPLKDLKVGAATLRLLGFKQTETFENEETGNQVTMWQAIINR